MHILKKNESSIGIRFGIIWTKANDNDLINVQFLFDCVNCVDPSPKLWHHSLPIYIPLGVGT